MADSTEPPALFDDDEKPESKPEEPPSLFGETTEISLDSDEKRDSEPAKVDAGAAKEDEEEAKPRAEPSSAASVDVTNLSESKEIETPKPKAEVRFILV